MILYDNLLEKNFSDLGIPIEKRGHRCHRELFQKYGDKIFYKIDCELGPLLKEDYLRAHSVDYVDKIFSSEITDEIYKAYELDKYGRADMDLVSFGQKVLAQSAITVEAMRVALTQRWSYFLGGGMHHAHQSYGHGFCLVNDIVIGIRKLQAEGAIKTAWVIDIDAHKGDGTAAMTAKDETIKTLSIHMEKGWPLEKGDHYPSDIDIPIGEGEDDQYLERLQEGLNQIEQCDLAVIVDGSDPYIKDGLPSTSLLQLSKKQMLMRDQMVYEHLSKFKIPQTYLLGGGYGDLAWEIHFQFLDYLVGQKSL